MATKTAPKIQQVDVTSVLPDVLMGERIRAQIKDLEKQLKQHEDMVKDVLGTAEEGVDSTGKVVVRFPVRNRTDLVKAMVQAKMDPVDYAACERVSSYRVLLYGA